MTVSDPGRGAAETAATGCRTFRYQLLPTSKQRVALAGLLDRQRELYNAALEERIGAWKWEGRSVSYFDQTMTLSRFRLVRPDTLTNGVNVCRGTLRRLDLAFGAFYRRCRAGEKPGFPRFKGAGRWDSVEWDARKGWRLDVDRGRLHLMGLGDIKVRLHRPIRGTPKTITVRREGRRWYLSVRCIDVPTEPLPTTGSAVGIDLGVDELVATSHGELIANKRPGRNGAARLAEAQRELAQKQPGSKRRRQAVERVAAHHRSVRNQRLDTLHKLSRRLVDDHDLLVHEDLRIANMVRRPKPIPDGEGGFAPNGAAAKSGLNRSIHDAGWGTLLAMLDYKAEDAGRTIIAVDPRNTSRRCASCGHVDARNRHGATFDCRACGHQAHADVNAAINILRAGRARQLHGCEGSELRPATPTPPPTPRRVPSPHTDSSGT